MKILYWNVNKNKNIITYINAIIQEHEPDLLIFSEFKEIYIRALISNINDKKMLYQHNFFIKY